MVLMSLALCFPHCQKLILRKVLAYIVIHVVLLLAFLYLELLVSRVTQINWHLMTSHISIFNNKFYISGAPQHLPFKAPLELSD